MSLKRWICMALAMILLLSGCAEGQPQETAAPTAAPTEEPTQAPTEPTEPENLRLAKAALPDADEATGALIFYFKDQKVYAGGPVEALLDAGMTVYDDTDQLLQPGHISGVQRVRVESENAEETQPLIVFFTAINPGSEPVPVRDCLIYSVTVNSGEGVRFGSGCEQEAFVTGRTTYEELTAAYGEPGYQQEIDGEIREIAYYAPFSCASFSLRGGVVSRINTYYSALIHEDLVHTLDHDFEGYYVGSDCYILMNQYLDVMPYLNSQVAEGTGTVEKLAERITMAGQEVELGIDCEDLPSPFAQALNGLRVPLWKYHYIRVGRDVGEEFQLINLNDRMDGLSNGLTVKGVFTQNINYVNRGADNSAFHEFRYEDLTQDSTIEDILQQYGAPMELHCTSSARTCFAWMYYQDEAGNTLHICVDPMLDQLIELRVSKHYSGEAYYR